VLIEACGIAEPPPGCGTSSGSYSFVDANNCFMTPTPWLNTDDCFLLTWCHYGDPGLDSYSLSPIQVFTPICVDVVDVGGQTLCDGECSMPIPLGCTAHRRLPCLSHSSQASALHSRS